MNAIKQMDKLSQDDLSDVDPKSREATQREEAKNALRRSFEHGAPETGAGDDLDFEDK